MEGMEGSGEMGEGMDEDGALVLDEEEEKNGDEGLDEEGNDQDETGSKKENAS
jgi:hypothetical protein